MKCLSKIVLQKIFNLFIYNYNNICVAVMFLPSKVDLNLRLLNASIQTLSSKPHFIPYIQERRKPSAIKPVKLRNPETDMICKFQNKIKQTGILYLLYLFLHVKSRKC